MPKYDRTGPIGAGPKTGLGLGRCGGHVAEGSRASQGVFGRRSTSGFPWGGGRGRCFGGRGIGQGRRPVAGTAPTSPAEETEALKAQLAAAKDEVAAIKTRLEELDKG